MTHLDGYGKVSFAVNRYSSGTAEVIGIMENGDVFYNSCLLNEKAADFNNVSEVLEVMNNACENFTYEDEQMLGHGTYLNLSLFKAGYAA